MAVAPTLGGFPVEPEIRRIVEAAAGGLRGAGAEVDLREPDWDWQELLWAGQVLLEFGSADSADAPRDLLMPYTAAFLDGIAARVPADFAHARHAAHRAWQAMRSIFEEADVLVAPTQGLFAFAVGDSYVDHGPTIDGVEVKYPFTTHLGLPFNVLNTLPVLTVPVAVCSNGVPTGVQIVGRPYRERAVFEVGAALESQRGEVLSYRRPEHRPHIGTAPSRTRSPAGSRRHGGHDH